MDGQQAIGITLTGKPVIAIIESCVKNAMVSAKRGAGPIA